MFSIRQLNFLFILFKNVLFNTTHSYDKWNFVKKNRFNRIKVNTNSTVRALLN